MLEESDEVGLIAPETSETPEVEDCGDNVD